MSEAQDPTSPIPQFDSGARHHHGPRCRPTPSIPTWRSPTRRRRHRPLAEPTAAPAQRGNGWAGWLLFALLGAATTSSPSSVVAQCVERYGAAARLAQARIDVAWKEAVESLGVLGIEANPAETPLELASRARIKGT